MPKISKSQEQVKVKRHHNKAYKPKKAWRSGDLAAQARSRAQTRETGERLDHSEQSHCAINRPPTPTPPPRLPSNIPPPINEARTPKPRTPARSDS